MKWQPTDDTRGNGLRYLMGVACLAVMLTLLVAVIAPPTADAQTLTGTRVVSVEVVCNSAPTPIPTPVPAFAVTCTNMEGGPVYVGGTKVKVSDGFPLTGPLTLNTASLYCVAPIPVRVRCIAVQG